MFQLRFCDSYGIVLKLNHISMVFGIYCAYLVAFQSDAEAEANQIATYPELWATKNVNDFDFWFLKAGKIFLLVLFYFSTYKLGS